jgi:hypothetical protein
MSRHLSVLLTSLMIIGMMQLGCQQRAQSPKTITNSLDRRGRALSVGAPALELPFGLRQLLRLPRCPEFLRDPQFAGGGQQVKISEESGRRHEASQGGCPRA